MAEQRIAVERHLGVEHDQPVVTRDDQRVDFQHVHVLGVERRVQLAEQLRALLGDVALQAERLGQGAAVGREDASGRIDGEGDDLVGRVVRHVFDIHAAFGRGDNRNARRDAIDQQGEVKLLGDVSALFNIEAVDLLASGAGLVCNQHAAEHFVGIGLDVFGGLDDADAALGVGAQAFEFALAAATRVNLRFDDENLGAGLSGQILGGLQGLVGGIDGISARNGDAELFEDGLSLMLVNVHETGLVMLAKRQIGARYGSSRPSFERGLYREARVCVQPLTHIKLMIGVILIA